MNRKPWTTIPRLYLYAGMLIACLVYVNPVSADTPLFVSSTGTGTDACTFDDPCNVAKAITNVDTGGAIHFAAGTYYGTGDQVILLDREISLYGGWDGVSSGPTPNRDPLTYPTILDGQNARRVITLDAAGSPTIDGFTIQNGNGTGLATGCVTHYFLYPASGCGGGIFVSSSAPTISNNIIQDNTATTISSEPEGNSGYGGGIYLYDASGSLVTENLIRTNIASTVTYGFGSGIYLYTCDNSTQVSDNLLTENYAAPGDGITNGVAAFNRDCDLQFQRNRLIANNPAAILDATILESYDSEINITDNLVTFNHGVVAVDLDMNNGPVLRNVIINPGMLNGLQFSGGGEGRFSIAGNNIIADHEHHNIYLVGTIIKPVTANFFHNTLSGSQYGLYLNTYASVIWDLGIVSNHTVVGIYDSGGTGNSLTVSQTLFYNNAADGTSGSSPFYGDPWYVDAVGFDYHISSPSLARDRIACSFYGDDVDGDIRPMGSGTTPCDLGADEFWWKDWLPFLHKP